MTKIAESSWEPPRRSGFGRLLKRLMIFLAVFAVLLVVGWFVAVASVKKYVQSERFRERIVEKVSEKLKANAEFSEVVWNEETSTATVAEFRADGFEGAKFASLEIRGIEARLELSPAYLIGSLREGHWVIPSVEVDEVRVVLNEERQPAPPVDLAEAASEPKGQPDADPEPESPDGKPRSFGIFPRKTRLGVIHIRTAGIQLESAGRIVNATLNNLVASSDSEKVYRVQIPGKQAEESFIETENLPRILIEELDVRVDQINRLFFADKFRAGLAGGQIQVSGQGGYGDQPSLQLKGAIDEVELGELVPKEWPATLTGKLHADIDVSGTAKDPIVEATAEVKGGQINDLPLLSTLADFLNEKRLQRLTFSRADMKLSGDDRGYRLSQIFVESPGFVRLQGSVKMDKNRKLDGLLDFGISADLMRFVPVPENISQPLFSPEQADHRWARVKIEGTLEEPITDLYDQLVLAGFEAATDPIANKILDMIDPSGDLKEDAGPLVDLLQKEASKFLKDLLE